MALLSKWVWRFKANPNDIWAKVVREIRGSVRIWSSLLPCKKVVAGPWKGSIKTMEELRKFDIDCDDLLVCKVGDDSDVEF